MRRQNQTGFAVMELLFVIVFLGVVTALLTWMISQKMAAAAKVTDAKLFCLGMTLYAIDHHNQYPTNLNQTLPYLREVRQSPGSPASFEILFRGNTDELTSPAVSQVIILRSAVTRDLNGNWSRIYGFADGHCETRIETDGNFAGWEKGHAVGFKGNL
jgi:hypothetical protein